MGNGPSLLKLLEEDKAVLAKYDFLAVNHMARSAQYEKFKPSIYVLCDPAFWFAKGYEIPQQLVKETFKSMVDKTTWPLQLYIPYQAKKQESKHYYLLILIFRYIILTRQLLKVSLG